MDEESRRATALETWKVYRRWAIAAVRMKARRERWRRAVFWLGLLGLLLGPLAGLRPASWPAPLIQAIALASGVSVALAAYLSDRVLGPDPDVAWVRARQAAEGLESLVFAFLMRAPPFPGGPGDGDLLAEARARIEDGLSGLVAEPIPPGRAEEGFPPSPLGAGEYVALRAERQQAWLEGKLVENHRTAERLEALTKVLGAAAAILSVPTAFWSGHGWIAVVTSVAGALGSQLAAGRYRFLERSYHETAARLARSVARWRGSPRGPDDDRRLVDECERALREENAAWVEAMLSRPGGTPRPAAPAGPPSGPGVALPARP